MFSDNFHAFKKRVSQYSDNFDNMTEEATKTAIIMPFLMLLGYDVFDPNEVMPEYVCDVAGKKGEKIDYVVLHDSEPIILIEAKRAGLKLQKQQQGQLYRYFSTNRCRLAILTNGSTYNFYSDINAPNVMDDDPFLSFNILSDDEELYLSSLEQFQKSVFNVKEILSKAVFLKYVKVVEQTLKQDLISPSDELVKYFLMRPEIRNGNRITTQLIDKHRAATAEAMRKVMGTTITEQQKPTSPAGIMTQGLVAELSKKSISSINTALPDAVCDCTENDGVVSISIKDNDEEIGRLRISNHKRVKIDYTKPHNGVRFYTNVDDAVVENLPYKN